MTVFSAGVAALFRDPNLSVAVRVLSPPSAPEAVETRAIWSRPDRTVDWGSSRAVAQTLRMDLPVRGLAHLAEGDRIELGADAFVVVGAPQRDRERLVWQVELRQVA